MRFIFIIAAGRSGSTTLQSLLNSDQNTLIRGENNNFFYETFTTYKSLQKRNNSDQRDHPWFGFKHFDPEQYQKTIRKLGKKYLLGDHPQKGVRNLGFKEIQLFNLFNSQGAQSKTNLLRNKGITPKKELLDYTKYLKKLYPKTKIIFLRRDAQSIAKSGWWKDQNIYEPQTLLNDLDSFQNECQHIASKGNDLCIDHEILRLKDLYSIQKYLYEPLHLDFNHHRAEQALLKQLTHAQWNS